MLTVEVLNSDRAGWFALSFKYHPGLLSVVRTLPQRRWDPDRKQWHIHADRVSVQALLGIPAQWHVAKDVRPMWQEHGGPVDASSAAPAHQNTRQFLEAGAPTLATKGQIPVGFWMPTLPLAKQREALEYAAGNEKFYLNMHVGTGKTKVFFDFARLAAVKLMRAIRVLLIGPNNKVPDYRHELKKHAGEENTHWRFFDARGGAAKWDKALKLLTADPCGLDVVGLNWESFDRRTKDLPAGSFDVLILDEAHCAKTPTSAQGKAALRMANNTRFVIAGSGTACPQGPFDLWNQIMMLNPNLLPSSFTAFKRRYAVQQLVEMNGNKFMQVLGYQNLTELRDIFARVSFRATKEECLDLPPVIAERRYVTLDPVSAEIYESIRKDGLALLGKDGAGTDRLTLTASAGVALLRARQVCGGFVGLTDAEGRSNGQAVATPANNKLRYVIDELVPEMMLAQQDRQIVIWAYFREELKALIAELQKKEVELPDGTKRLLRVTTLWGDTPKADRDALTERFRNREFDILVSNPQSGGVGMEFQTADVEIWYSRDYNLKLREQGEGRLHRMGQKRSVIRFDVLYEGTIEDTVLEALEAKRDLQQLLTNDPKHLLREVFE